MINVLECTPAAGLCCCLLLAAVTSTDSSYSTLSCSYTRHPIRHYRVAATCSEYWRNHHTACINQRFKSLFPSPSRLLLSFFVLSYFLELPSVNTIEGFKIRCVIRARNGNVNRYTIADIPYAMRQHVLTSVHTLHCTHAFIYKLHCINRDIKFGYMRDFASLLNYFSLPPCNDNYGLHS